MSKVLVAIEGEMFEVAMEQALTGEYEFVPVLCVPGSEPNEYVSCEGCANLQPNQRREYFHVDDLRGSARMCVGCAA